jgi:ubiquinone/menaquinone biosynthesis C-methylase UbiE
VQGVGEVLPFTDASFDVLLLMGTLDHARNPGEVLEQAARVLRPGGVLGVLQGVVSAPPGGLGGLLRSVVKSFSNEQGPGATETHLHSFTSADQVVDLIAAYFEVQDTAEHDSRVFIRALRPEAEEGA